MESELLFAGTPVLLRNGGSMSGSYTCGAEVTCLQNWSCLLVQSVSLACGVEFAEVTVMAMRKACSLVGSILTCYQS